MGFRLTGQMMSATLRRGGPQDGTPNWASTAVTALGKRSVRRNVTARMADLSSLEDDEDSMQYTRKGGTQDFEFLIPSTGAQFAAWLGEYVEVQTKELASLSAPIIDGGVISAHSLDMPDGASIERITVTLGANGYVPYTP